VRALIAWVPALAWAALVWTIGGIQDVSGVPSIRGLDKVAHFGMYGVLGFLLGWGWFRSAARGRSVAVVALLLALAMGAADERRQGRLPGRSQDPLDWLADAAGIAAGFTLALRNGRRATKHEHDHEHR